MHVGAQNSQVVLIVNSASINCILKDTINLLPLDPSGVTIVLEVKNNCLSSFEITIGEFVVFSPTLRDISSSLLDESMEPRENEEKLSLGKFQLLALGRSDVLEGTHQVVTDSWWGFIGNLKT